MDNCLRRSHREWLSDLTIAGEPECMSILYAESLLGPNELFSRYGNDARRIFMGQRYPMESVGTTCEVPIKPQRCIARMTSLGCTDVMTASTPIDNLRQKTDKLTVKFGHPRMGCSQRPVSAMMSDELVLRAHGAAMNHYTADHFHPSRRNDDARTLMHFSATLPTHLSGCRNSRSLLHCDCCNSSHRHSTCYESSASTNAPNCVEKFDTTSSTVLVNSPHQRGSPHDNSRHVISCYDLPPCQSTAPPAHAKSNHNSDIFTSNFPRQRICTCRLGSASRVSVTGSILNIAVSGETSSRSTFSPSLYLSPESELSPSSAQDPSHHGGLEDERRSKNSDVGICNNLLSPVLPPTHNRDNMCRCTNEGDVHCVEHISASETRHSPNDCIKRRSAEDSISEDSGSSRTLCTDTLFCSEHNNGKETKDHSSEMRNSEQFGSTITIHVPSPTSFSRQDVASSGTQSMSGREPIKAESSPLKADVNLSCRRMPPSYSQLRIIHEGDRTTSRVMLGQSPLFVGGSPEQTVVFANRCRVASCGPTTSTTASSTSPKSSDSGSNSSVDSGQGSGDLSSRSHSSKDFSESGASYTQYARNNLPSYVRVASIMDHVLRTSSAMNSLLGSTNDASTSKELITKANMFIQIIEISPCARFLPVQDITVIKELLSDLQSQPNCTNRPIVTSSYFAFMLRKLMEEVLMIFARIISRYLSDCINKDRLLVIALEHLIHLMLFGDDICLEIIHSGGLNAISSFIRMPTTPNDTLRLLLRTLAILCRLPKGALKLLSLGRLDIIIQILCTRSVGCAVEAAGVLAQLTNPTHALIKLNDSSTYIIARLLDVVDECSTAESLLLCAAAIANVSAQHRALVDNLYQHNATARLIAALKRPGCDTVFVHEQLAVVFSRLANEGYEEALIAQGALPILLSMLTLSDLTHVEYCHRIRYKAALCLATIASKGFGLKAIYQNNGYTMVSKAIKKEQVSTTPTAMICNGIKEKLERKYQLESAV